MRRARSAPVVEQVNLPSPYIGRMARVTLYLPEDVLAVARERAGRENSSLSACRAGRVSVLIREAAATEWPEGLVNLLHSGSADLAEPDDPPPEDAGAFLTVERFRA